MLYQLEQLILKSTAQLSQHTKFAVTNAVRHPSQNLGNLGLKVGNDKSTRAAVSRQVRKERSTIMYQETGGKKIDDYIFRN
jgi:hypothetical protein